VHAHGYLLNRGHLEDVTSISPSVYWAAGSIVSNANDVARFYRALIAGRLLRPDLLRTVERSVPPAQGYGLGIFRAKFPCGVFYGHDGAPIGYNAITYTSTDGRRQFVVLTNSGTPDDAVGSPKAQRLFQRLVLTAACG
jgi:D-alanyl-D-alanine carboxypeptidase